MSSTESEGKKADIASGDAMAPLETPLVVYVVCENDIMLGRGAPMIRNLGNVRFREIIGQHKVDYMSSGRHHVKNEIAKQVLEVIAQRQGRFLRRIEAPEEAKELGVPTGKRAWVLADNTTILEKVKQSLRDKDSNNPEPTEPVNLVPGHASAGYTPTGVAYQPPGATQMPPGMAQMSLGVAQLQGLVNSAPPIGAAQQLANLRALISLARLRRQDKVRRLQLILQRQQALQMELSLQFHQPAGQAQFSTYGIATGTCSLYQQPTSHLSRAALQALTQASLQRRMMSALGNWNGDTDVGAIMSSHANHAQVLTNALPINQVTTRNALASTEEKHTLVTPSISETENSSSDEGNSSSDERSSAHKRKADNFAASKKEKKSRAQE